MASRLARAAAALGVAAMAVAAIALVVGPGSPREVKGTVTDTSGARIEGAVVRIQTTTAATRTDEFGRFSIAAPGPGEPVLLTA